MFLYSGFKYINEVNASVFGCSLSLNELSERKDGVGQAVKNKSKAWRAAQTALT